MNDELIHTETEHTEQKGQGLIEYALLLMLVAFVVLGLIIAFGGSVGSLYSNIVRAI